MSLTFTRSHEPLGAVLTTRRFRPEPRRWVTTPEFDDPALQRAREATVAAIYARMRQQVEAHRPSRIERARHDRRGAS